MTRMDKNKMIKIGVIAILIALVVVTFVQGSSHSKTKKLAQELTVQVDTLTSTLEEYNDLRVKYVDLQNEMVQTSNELGRFKNTLNEITKAQQSSLKEVRNKLTQLINEFDTVQFNLPVDSVTIDDLKF